MRFLIVLTGDELTEGRQADANGQYLASALHQRGFDAGGIVVVGDEQPWLVATLKRALAENDVVVCSGGLGGTADDLTRFALSEAVDSPLVANDEAMAALRNFWARLNRPFPTESPWEGMMPALASMVPNNAGLAPGMLVEHENSKCLCLPGVPSELRQMVEDGALDLLGHPEVYVSQGHLRVVNMREPVIAQTLGDIMERGRNPLCGIAAKQGEVVLSLRAKAPSLDQAQGLIQADVSRIKGLLGDHVYSTDRRDLVAVVTDQLRRHQQTLSVSESLTGGLIGHLMTELPGASDVFLADFVTYANDAKSRVLQVKAETLAEFGAVSEAVARQMAESTREIVDADFGLATTGIAGPGGGSRQKPVGTCWVAASFRDGTTWAEKKIHGGSRRQVKRRSANHALDLLRRLIHFANEKNGAK